MDLKRPREVYGKFLGLCEWPECLGQSRSPECLELGGLAGRGGSPGRPRGRPWAAGAAAAGRPGKRLGVAGDASWKGRIPLPGASVGGTTLVAPNGSKRTENDRFPEGAGPAPRPESQATWLLLRCARRIRPKMKWGPGFDQKLGVSNLKLCGNFVEILKLCGNSAAP